ncbi:hypothetical protein XU18_1092 [Perkinsela sp. CCAP 1560/4]|nr:hypothetical protein XU18_1092 [Perkinsela sp. CCAP 1560/4]|eukprot:KNH08379.1 hypothetical protein XU18_1092 [Perkinsela sp. CCAP 1560/4]
MFKLRDIKEVFEILGVKHPQLVKVGEKPPKLIVSFGDSDILMNYGLGVAQYLLDNHLPLLKQAYFIGTGSGTIPAVCLSLASQNSKSTLITDFFRRMTSNISSLPIYLREAQRREFISNTLKSLASLDEPEKLLLGKCSLFLHPNPNFIFGRVHGILDRYHVLYGLPVSEWRSKEDLIQCIEASMAPSYKHFIPFRGIPIVKASRYSLSPQVDQAIRHVYVHGYAGGGYMSREKLHAHVFGHHGSIFNVSTSHYLQRLCISYPRVFSGSIEKTYHQGYKDAAQFSRWEEDPYHYSRGVE